MIGIETDSGLSVEALAAAGYEVFAVNPLAVARYRDRHQVSGAKSDAANAKPPVDAARLSLSTIRSALKAAGRQRNLDSMALEIQTALRTEQLATPTAVTAAFGATTRAAVAIIAEHNQQITALEAELATHFDADPDADIDLSLPRLGVILGTRVLGEFRDDPNRYTAAKSRKNCTETSPLTVASGETRAVLVRHVRNRRLYHAIDQWAFSALTTSEGTPAFLRPTPSRWRHVPPSSTRPGHGCIRHDTLCSEHQAWAHRQSAPDAQVA